MKIENGKIIIKYKIMKISLWIRMLYSEETEQWVNKISRFAFICDCVRLTVQHVLTLKCYIARTRIEIKWKFCRFAIVKFRSWTIFATLRWFNSSTLHSSPTKFSFDFNSGPCNVAFQCQNMFNCDAHTDTDEC